MPSQDSLKRRIHKREVVIGVSAPITADRQRIEDILSRDSYDFVSVDSQHAAFNEEKLVQFCAIAKELDIPVQFRIKHTRLDARDSAGVVSLVIHSPHSKPHYSLFDLYLIE